MCSKKADGPPTNQEQVYRALLHQILSHIEECTCPLLIKHKSTEPYYTMTVIYWEVNTYPGQTDPPLIKHKSTEPYYTMTVWSIEKSTHTQGRWTPLLIEPTTTEPNYTKYVSHIEECPCLPLIKHKSTEPYYTGIPTNQAQVDRALLPQDSITHWGSNTYLGQTDPPH